MKQKIATLIATYCGLGLSPKAPGTVGSFGTLPLAYILLYYGGLPTMLIAAVIVAIVGIWATDVLIRDQEEKDPGKVVVDEVVGQLLAFSLIPQDIWRQQTEITVLIILLLGFGFFRLFDICKRGPVKWFDSKMKNAVGVMMDDVCAGIFAAVCLGAVYYGIKAYVFGI